METILTTSELFKKYSWTAKLDGETLKVVDKEDFKKVMIEFTSRHVEAAIKAKVNAMIEKSYEDPSYSMNELDSCTRDIYPLENIK